MAGLSSVIEATPGMRSFQNIKAAYRISEAFVIQIANALGVEVSVITIPDEARQQEAPSSCTFSTKSAGRDVPAPRPASEPLPLRTGEEP